MPAPSSRSAFSFGSTPASRLAGFVAIKWKLCPGRTTSTTRRRECRRAYGGGCVRAQGRRRRLSIIGVAVIAILVAGPEFSTGAEAAVANPGRVDLSMTLAVITPALAIEGVTTSHPAQGN